MKLSKRIKNAMDAFKNSAEIRTLTLADEELAQWLGLDARSMDGEITYYTCLKMLSETIAKLPMKYYQDTDNGRIRAKPDEITYLLTTRPNPYMTPTTFWGSVELNRNQCGNAYVLLHRVPVKAGRYDIGETIKDMWIMPSQNVTILIDNVGIFGGLGKLYYQYSDSYSGKQYVYSADDVMHFKTFWTKDGIAGKPVVEILRNTIDGALESQNFMNNLYKNGLTSSMVMQYVGDLSDENIRKLQEKYAKYLCGSANAGKITPVPIGLKLEPIKSTLVDAQFFELKKYSALQIAGAFGIKPNQINNYEKSSYSNSEMQQLSFLVDTMLYIIKHYEEEINHKVLGKEKTMEGYLYKFNEKAILRTDSKTQMENLTKAVNNAVYTPNEARGFLDMPTKEGGDILMCNGNYIPITQVGKQYKEKGGSE